MTIRTRKPGVKTGMVSLASSLLVLTSVVATAQEAETVAADEDMMLEEVVVKGMRQSLESAQDIKRNAPTVVDSITAKDLGSFPDKSVAEALQRVAGITVNRFAASSDTAHFSAEPSGVVVRGLNQVRTEFNGRTSFSANSSRGLSWGDVSPELMAGVDTYKNQMAELIEGGIAGTVNMRTRLPFDQDGQMMALTINGNYGDLSEELTPEVSGLYSNRWETSAGEFGFLGNFAYSDVTTKTEGVQYFRMNRFRNIYGEDTLRYIPATVNMRENIYDRVRKGVALAMQYQNPSETVVLTTQYNRSEYDNAWEEYVVQVSPADLSFGESVFFEVEDAGGAPVPAPGAGDFVFDDQGLFQTGVMNSQIGWWGNDNAESAGFAANAAGQPMVNACYGWNGCEPATRGSDMTAATRSNNNQNMTQDFSVNLKWSISDSIRSNFDVQYVDSTVQNYDIEVGMGTYADVDLDISGELPSVNLLDPTNVNLSPGKWANPNNYRIHNIMDHVEDSSGDQLALKADFEFDIDNGWLESIKTGARWAERDQEVRWSGYNWQNVANTWTGDQAPYYNVDRTEPANGEGAQPDFNGYPSDFAETRLFGESSYHDINMNEFVFANMDTLQDQELMASTMSAQALGFSGGTGWDPICSNTGDRADEVAGTCYTPSEIVDIVETTSAAYIQFNFGGEHAELFGIPFSGNLGVRYVETDITSSGGIALPRLGDEFFFTIDDEGERVPDPTRTNLGCEIGAGPVDPDAPPPEVPNSMGCYLGDDDVAFMDGADQTSVAESNDETFLPSFNIKFDLTDELVLRFAASKAMARPDIGNLRNYVSVGSSMPDRNNADDPLWIKDGNGEITGANVRYNGGAQNPFLKPIKATQFDLALEYYFADVGSFTFTLFQKSFEDYIQFSTYNREFTNNGVTRTAEINGPVNGDGADIQGFEVAYQTFFDFLPEPFDGLGIQANYTYIENEGITNTNISNVGGEATTITGQAPDQISVDRLEGLSDNAFNIVGMYEKGPIAARLAYSWRDEFMVTAIDCCVAYPIWNEAYGALDGSIKYELTDNIDIRFQASNLLNEETVLKQQVTNVEDGGLLLPNARFQNDRRYTVGVQMQF
ncbi:TonB-dependent receptor [Gilvimarinus sp. SDUM040013]|uniref:TonB-dependent receptor n=1 Tax=Gilvimarinus gilvus TaxID=3058038 RepID=A0ABU4S1H1_9GAMM|nr:TonB-dependent receptor [Gilvimarinus sp. SDUM040013]MDO3384417.1 TonB-dependent receptor [Gilvimarinus sp. SDUM040013]MDX6851022.1 TonB-dependent receptor [Gilvimarinus sp. SDUM040013]